MNRPRLNGSSVAIVCMGCLLVATQAFAAACFKFPYFSPPEHRITTVELAPRSVSPAFLYQTELVTIRIAPEEFLQSEWSEALRGMFPLRTDVDAQIAVLTGAPPVPANMRPITQEVLEYLFYKKIATQSLRMFVFNLLEAGRAQVILRTTGEQLTTVTRDEVSDCGATVFYRTPTGEAFFSEIIAII